MKRLLLLGAAVVAAVSVTPTASAAPVATDMVATDLASGSKSDVAASSGSILNPILNQLPLLGGPDRRHVCVISDQLDRSYCVYVNIP